MQLTSDFHSEGFERGIRMAMDLTERSTTEELNQRAMNVAGRAMNNTKMADKAQIQRTLGEVGRAITFKVLKSGRNAKRVMRGARLFAAANNRQGGPRAALIINARRAKKGLPGLEGREMESAIRKMVGAKLRSVGFKKSGYIPAIRALARGIDKPFYIGKMQGISIRGAKKGAGSPAIRFHQVATIENSVKDITSVPDEQALQNALDQEGNEMVQHFSDKLNGVADQFNASQHP
jgi:ribosomal protein S12